MGDYELQPEYEDHIYEYESPIEVSLPQTEVRDHNKCTNTTKDGKNECQKKTVVALVVISIILCVAVITLSVMMYSIKNNIDQLQMISPQTDTRIQVLNTSLQNQLQMISPQTDTRIQVLNTSLQSTPIAFSGRVKNVLTNLGDNQDILFETVVTNIGQAFHPETGVFSCPRNGVYAFLLTILCYPNTRVNTKIVKNGTLLAAAYSRSVSRNVYGTGSTSVIVRLQTGDKVWVQVNGDGHTGSGKMIYNKSFSSFTGFSLMLE